MLASPHSRKYIGWMISSFYSYFQHLVRSFIHWHSHEVVNPSIECEWMFYAFCTRFENGDSWPCSMSNTYAFAYRKYMTIISFESVCIVWATLWRRRQWAMMVVVAKKENGQFPCTSLSDDRPILLMLLSLLLATYSLPITSIFQLIVSTFGIATSVRVRVWCDAGAALAKCLYNL